MFGSSTNSGFGSSTNSNAAFSFPSTTTTTTAPTNSGFGFSANANPSGFGAKPTATTGFGTSTAQPSFGFQTAAPVTTAAQPTAGFGFPSATPTTAQPTTGFGFPSTTTTAAPSSGFGFPSATTTTTGFGFPPATTSAPSSGFGFGAKTPTTTTNTPSSGFGFPSTSSMTTTTTGFGTSAPTPGGFGGFGATGGFGTAGVTPSTATTTRPSLGVVSQSLEKIQTSYSSDNNNNDCEFKAVMYNRKSDLAPYQQQQQLQQTDSLMRSSSRFFEEAEHNNKDPDNCYPVLELGISALKKRFDSQATDANKLGEHMKSLKELTVSVETVNNQLCIRYDNLKAKQMNLYHSLLSLMRKVEVLRSRGQGLQQSELKFRERLLAVLQAAGHPLTQLRELLSADGMQQKSLGDNYGEISASEDLSFIYDALQRQRDGLEYITEIVSKDLRDINIIRKKLLEESIDSNK